VGPQLIGKEGEVARPHIIGREAATHHIIGKERKRKERKGKERKGEEGKGKEGRGEEGKVMGPHVMAGKSRNPPQHRKERESHSASLHHLRGKAAQETPQCRRESDDAPRHRKGKERREGKGKESRKAARHRKGKWQHPTSSERKGKS
jgi:hypothetical protein